jgi:hypothetical protein
VSNGARVAVPAGASNGAAMAASDAVASDVKFCAIDNPDCEACQ